MCRERPMPPPKWQVTHRRGIGFREFFLYILEKIVKEKNLEI